MKKILVIGGAGYVGSMLVPELIKLHYQVTVLDLFIYGDTLSKNKNLELIKGDIRDIDLIKKIFQKKQYDEVIHLACISNDPSFELNPSLGKSINFDCFEPLVKISKNSGVSKFIFASSSSVYGVKEHLNVNEGMSLEPLTDYSKFKAMCEDILLKYNSKDFSTCILRPATVCGYSPRQRLDVVVNIFANFAYFKKKIIIFGGEQLRPNINIMDMVRAYTHILEQPIDVINGQVFNVGYENHNLMELANITKKVIDRNVEIAKELTNDNRSYHISSKKIFQTTNFKPEFTITDAVQSIKYAFDHKLLHNTFDNSDYFNIKKMKEISLT